MPTESQARQALETLLKREAEAMGVAWPEDYPSPGGWRGWALGIAARTGYHWAQITAQAVLDVSAK